MIAITTIVAPLHRFVGVLFRPEQAFEQIGTKPYWLGSYIYLCAGKMLVEYLHSLVALPVLKTDVFSSLDPSTMEKTQWLLRATNYVTIVLTPVAIMIKGLITAGLLYWLIILVDKQVEFKKMLSVAIHCWVIVLIARFFNLLILYLKGPEQLVQLEDLKVNLGLDILLKGNENVVIRTICESITIFSLWYLIILILGVSIVSGISKRKASAAVIFIWIMNVAWKIGQSMFNRTIETPFH